MSLQDEIAARRAAMRQPQEPHISIDTADALNHLAGTINGFFDSLWDALEVVARAVDESRGQGVDS